MDAVHKEKAVELMKNARELIGTLQKYILKHRKNKQAQRDLAE
jgi:hypothetical protein